MASARNFRRMFSHWEFKVGLCFVLLSFIVVPFARSSSFAAETSPSDEKARAGVAAGAAIAAAAVAAGLSPAAVVGLFLGAAAVGMAKASSEDEDGEAADPNSASAAPNTDDR